jgi:hypothetical protein
MKSKLLSILMCTFILLTFSVSAFAATSESSNVSVGQIIKFGKYEWQVLAIENDRILIITKDIPEERAYNTDYEGISWEKSTLRNYLNNDFYNQFTDDEKAMILETKLTNSNNPWYGTDGGFDTKDKIFLLSLDETVKYFGDSGAISNKNNGFGNSDTYIDDQYNDKRLAYYKGGDGWWWLRTPGYIKHLSSLVYFDGSIYLYGGPVDRDFIGVRPALWLTATGTYALAEAEATPTASNVLVNGKQIAFDAYNIGGNNYFKLRDLACVLSGSDKQFEVTWDGENNTILLSSSTPYTIVGGEMEGKGTGNKMARLNSSKILLNGKEITLRAYTINGNNYFKLRDIGQAFNFGVVWDSANNTIIIDTNIEYTE